MTDEDSAHRPPSRDEDGFDVDVSTGDPIDARFDVELSGELDIADLPDEDAAPTGSDDASYAVGSQEGESMPPELLRREPSDELEPIELADPTDPGFTRADLAGSEPPAEPTADVIDLPISPESAPPHDETPDAAADGTDLDAVGFDDDLDDLGLDDGEQRPLAWEAFSGDDYVGSSTQEYEGLAAELQRSQLEQHEPSAVAAAIPGIDSGVVGLEDVTGEATPVIDDAAPTLTDLSLRIATGLGLLALFFLSLLTPIALGLLATVVFTLAAIEFYATLIKKDHHPISLFGIGGVLGCLLGAWIWGVVAIPVAVIATLIAVALFYGTAAPRRHTLRDAALTVLGTVWIGGFGAFALAVVSSDDYGWLITGVVVLVVAMDVGQFFAGRTFGRRPLAPVLSPKKTVEGLLGGAVITFAFGYLLSFFGPFTLASAMALATGAVVVGPLGDLAVSSMKRQLGIKDMGTLLPGHGGLLDRIDALLFVIPAAWIALRATGLIA